MRKKSENEERERKKLTLSPSRLRRPNSYMCIFGELVDPQLIQLLLVGYPVEVGDEGPDLGIGKAVVHRVQWDVLRTD